MKVSVVICTYSEEMYEHFREAVESIQRQTYDDIELILVVDGNEELYERVETEYGDLPDVKTHCNEENLGLSGSRNNALEYVTGDVVALIDDDAVADERWVEELVSVYEEEEDAIAAGGRLTPIWVAGEPGFLPEEFYWLIGVNRPGFAEDGEEVRNTYGSNISFRTHVLEELGGFETRVGRQGEKNLQKHETEFCARMAEEFGRGVVYNHDATVGHKVFKFRTELTWILERSFWQGYSERVMEEIVSEGAGDAETEFLKELAFEAVPARLKGFATAPSVAAVVQFVMLFVLTGTVGLGYLYGMLDW